MSIEQALVWIDLEMTGLDPDRDVIVEIATIVTDGSLDVVEQGPDLVVAAPAAALEQMEDVVRRMHTRSGLLEALEHCDRTVAEAEAETLEFVRKHVPDAAVAPLAGNSVHADRMFLRRYMPELEAHLHYRNVDVSTLKEIARRWRPQLLEAAPDKSERHRALDDILESIEELRFYRDALFGDDAPGSG
ncbi:MAG TPA: oligoribonuclease [Euzebyales bacterium]|nr:oligoribonuclease [Euzebyales bacterium]